MDISSNFTIEDIHNIRHDNYAKTKTMLPNELIEKTKKEALPGWTKLAEIKLKQNKLTPKTPHTVR